MKTTFCFCCGINQGRLIFKGANSDDHLPKKTKMNISGIKSIQSVVLDALGHVEFIETQILFLLWNRAE